MTLSPEDVVRDHAGLVWFFIGKGIAEGSQLPAEDIAQEGLIALWQAALANPGHDLRGGLATATVKRAMYSVARGSRSETGHSVGRGSVARVEDASAIASSLDEPVTQNGESIKWDSHAGLVSGEPTPEDVVVGRDESARRSALLYRSIGRLNPGRRDVMLLTLEGLSQPEIGRRLGMSKAQVNNRAREARELLRAYLTPHLA